MIMVNRKATPFPRRTFSLLHEFADLMLRVSGVSDLNVDDTRPPEDQAVEVFCNRVAGTAALLPRDVLLSHPEVTQEEQGAVDWSDDQLSNLSPRFWGEPGSYCEAAADIRSCNREFLPKQATVVCQ